MAAVAADVIVWTADALGEDRDRATAVLLLAAADLVRPDLVLAHPARTAAMLEEAMGEALDAFATPPPPEVVTEALREACRAGIRGDDAPPPRPKLVLRLPPGPGVDLARVALAAFKPTKSVGLPDDDGPAAA